MINKNLVFIYSMQFMNSSLEKIVKNLSDDDFKYLTDGFGSENLELLKQRGVYPYEHIDRFERFNEEKLPDRTCFYRDLKNGRTGDNGEKLDREITDKEYLPCKKNYYVFRIKNMCDYQDHYLKKDMLKILWV